MKYLYEEMLPAEFLAAVERMPAFIIPTGLLEWHADHLPLGQDTLKIYGIAKRVAEKLGGGIVLPPQYIGRPGYSRYTGTLTYSEGLVTSLFYEMFGQLKKVGAKVIALLTGHYGPLQVDCLKRIAACFAAENPDITVIAMPEYEGVTVDGEVPGDHAGKWETSMFWHFYPELTHMDKFREEPLPMLIYPDPPNNYYREPASWMWRDDICAESSPERGERAVEIISDHIAALIREALREKGY